MSHPDVLGWLAAGLMVATFSCREARAMRPLAVATNLAFIGYGAAASLGPVLALHLLLLPINLWRCGEAPGVKESVMKLLTLLNRSARALALMACLALAACGGGDPAEPAPPGPPSPPPPALDPVTMVRQYELGFYRGAARDYDRALGTDINTRLRSLGSEFRAGLMLGPLTVLPDGRSVEDNPNYAHLEVMSNASGFTYAAMAEAPAAPQVEDIVGGRVQFIQAQQFRKRSADARLRYVVSRLSIVMLDGNSADISKQDCPWFGANVNACLAALSGTVAFELDAMKVTGTGVSRLKRVTGFVWAMGWNGKWAGDTTWDDGEAMAERWNFRFSHLEEPTGGRNVVELEIPIVIEIPLDQLRVDDDVVVVAKLDLTAFNHRQRESYVGVYFRDPAGTGGNGAPDNGLEASGLEAVSVTADLSPGARPPVEDPTPACPAAAGPQDTSAVAFERPAFDAAEVPGPAGLVTLVRTGSSAGEVSVRLTTRDGTALAGKDYLPMDRRVRFRPGETSRTVLLPLVLDGEPEPDKQLTMEISEPRGCVALGAQGSTAIVIADDDRPVLPVPTYAVGGSVTGLVGSGLVLHDAARFLDLPIGANGSFRFPQGYAGGTAYDVQVKAPAVNPAQQCVVTRGSGVVGNADVLDVEVACTTPSSPGGLDTSFGALGKVASGLPGGAIAIARQSTGHIVATSGARLVRYHPDGRLDVAFGGGAGHVDNLLTGSGAEVADITVLPDDRIVVAGRILQPNLSPPYYQMAAARFRADGTRDTSFGSGGMATFRLAGIAENATRVLALPDGRVVLVGQATVLEGPFKDANSNIALVRLNLDGSPDPGFGASGAVTADALKRDFALAAALQADGRLVVAGRTSNNSGDPTDTLFTRIQADGLIEAGFGRNPAYSALDDAAVDMALQGDGKIVLLLASKGINMEVALVRLHPDGSLDTGFGSNGIARSDPGPHDDLPRAVAMQADGRIVVAAQLSAGLGSPDFGLLRFLADGTPDPGFGAAGVLRVDFFGGFDSANDLLVQPDGRIVAAGFARSGLNTDIAMVRLHP